MKISPSPSANIGAVSVNAPQAIKMETQVSTDRGPDEKAEISAKPDVVEDIKPLSPQLAELAKARRSLQIKERDLETREKALQSQVPEQSDLSVKLKSQTLQTLQEQGLLTPEFYNSFTEFLVSGQAGLNPDIQALKDEIKTLKEGVDKSFTDRDQQAEKQVLDEMRRQALELAKDDQFENVREEKAVPQVIELIHRTYKKTGEVMDVDEALKLVEDHLREQNFKRAQYKSIQSRFQALPPQPVVPSRQPMRTLTNRDTATVPMDRRSRALLAALGQLK
jgi:hypothetical protein